MNPLISVIIPVYKVEAYLNRCVDSVLSQTFRDIEIVLVDDGSPDACPKICDEYAQKDLRIKVIHKMNGGLSDARNIGLQMAKGQYIMFMDSDDFWEDYGSLSLIVKSIKKRNPDVILYGCKDFYEESGEVKISRMGYDVDYIRSHSVDEGIQYLFESNLFPGSAWLLVVKKSLLIDNHIFFVKGIKAEDYDWLINLFLHIQSIDAVNEPFYIYIKGRADSITGTSDLKSIDSILFTVDKWFPILQKGTSNRNRYLLNLLAFAYLTSLVTYANLNRNQKNSIISEIKKRSFIVKYALVTKVKILSVILKMLGVENMSRLIKLCRK